MRGRRSASSRAGMRQPRAQLPREAARRGDELIARRALRPKTLGDPRTSSSLKDDPLRPADPGPVQERCHSWPSPRVVARAAPRDLLERALVGPARGRPISRCRTCRTACSRRASPTGAGRAARPRSARTSSTSPRSRARACSPSSRSTRRASSRSPSSTRSWHSARRRGARRARLAALLGSGDGARALLAGRARRDRATGRGRARAPARADQRLHRLLLEPRARGERRPMFRGADNALQPRRTCRSATTAAQLGRRERGVPRPRGRARPTATTRRGLRLRAVQAARL